MDTLTWHGLTHQCREDTLMHQTPGQLVGTCCWFKRPWSETLVAWWKGSREWQLASSSKRSGQHSITRGLVDGCDADGWCEETPWTKWVSLTGWLMQVVPQLGGYASSYFGCGNCITTNRLLGFEIQIVNYKLDHLKRRLHLWDRAWDVLWMLKGFKHCTLTQAKCWDALERKFCIL